MGWLAGSQPGMAFKPCERFINAKTSSGAYPSDEGWRSGMTERSWALLASPKRVNMPKDLEHYNPDGYASFLTELKIRIREARFRSSLAVNRELILLYWQIGSEILARQKQEGWGAKIVDRLAGDLRRDFPEMTGLSARNLKYMRMFAEAYPEPDFVQQVVARLPWGHNIRLIEAVKDSAEREWYARQAIHHGGVETSSPTRSRATYSSGKARPSQTSAAHCQRPNQSSHRSLSKIHTRSTSLPSGRRCWNVILSEACLKICVPSSLNLEKALLSLAANIILRSGAKTTTSICSSITFGFAVLL